MNSQITTALQTLGRHSVSILVAVTATLAIVGCNQNLGHPTAEFMGSGNFENRASAVAAAPIDYATILKQVFQPHCLKCHSSDTAKGDVVLDVYNSAFLARAEVRTEVETDAMPRRAPALTPELKALLFAWIDAGAPER